MEMLGMLGSPWSPQASCQSKSSGGEEIAVALLGLFIRPLEKDSSGSECDMETAEEASDDDDPIL